MIIKAMTLGVFLSIGSPQTMENTAPPLMDCLCDINSDGICNNEDLLIFLGQYGQASTEADYNENGYIDIFDMAEFMRFRGTICP